MVGEYMNEPLTLTKELEFQLGNINMALESYSTTATKVIVLGIHILNSDEINIHGFVKVEFLYESSVIIRHQKIIDCKFRYDKLEDKLYTYGFKDNLYNPETIPHK